MKPTYVGITVAATYFALKVIFFLAGIQNDILAGKMWLILMALILVGIFYAINRYIRTSDTYDWMAAFKRGLTVSLTASVIIGILLFIYYQVIDPGYLENLSIEEYNRTKSLIKKEDLEKHVAQMKDMYTPKTFSIMTVSIVNITGLIGSLILGMLGRMTVKKA